MLYRTQRPFFFFPFTPFTTPIHPPPPPTATTTAATLPSIQRMECVEGAFKSSVRRPEMAVLDDSWSVNGQSGGVPGDDFFVDDLLDFSKGNIEDGIFEEEAEHEHEKRQAEKDKDFDPTRSNFSGVNDFPAAPCNELSVPADDLADLEWLSHFVEDCFSEYSLTYPAGKLPEKPGEQQSEPLETPAPTLSCFATPVQTKARSKRARTGGRVWSLGSPSLTESSSLSSSSLSSSSSSSTTSTSSPPNNPWLIYAGPSQTADSLLGSPPPAPPPLPTKKQKKKKETSGGSGGSQQQQPRRCSHCLVQKTPQWRAGPLGAKTLCNACGVRYKSGRLLPEYRPACSPTFSSDIHSNNHRKVLEMRQKKEMEAGPAPPVQSF